VWSAEHTGIVRKIAGVLLIFAKEALRLAAAETPVRTKIIIA